MGPARLSTWTAGESSRIFVILQMLHGLVLWLVPFKENGITLIASGTFSCILCAWLFGVEVRTTAYSFSPKAAYLIAAFVRTGLSACWAGLVVRLGFIEILQAGVYDVSDFLLRGQGLFIVGDALFIMGYQLVAGRERMRKPECSLRSVNSLPYGLLTAIAGTVVTGILAFGGIPASIKGIITQFGAPLTGAGLLILFWGAIPGAATRLSYNLVAAGLIMVPAIWFTMQTNMKQNTLMMLIPSGVYLLQLASLRGSQFGRVRFWGRSSLLALGMFILWILFPYSQLRRDDIWAQRDRESHRTIGVAPYLLRTLQAAVLGSDEFWRVHEFPNRGMFAFCARHALIPYSAWACQAVSRGESGHAQYTIDAVLALIPRILWPEKPAVAQGRKIAARLGQAATAEEATTSSCLGGLAPLMYYDVGFWGMIPGVVSNGALVAVVWLMCSRSMRANPFAYLLAMRLFLESLRYFEAAPPANLPFHCYNLLLLCLMRAFDHLDGRTQVTSVGYQRARGLKKRVSAV